jgi:hypothetical protein
MDRKKLLALRDKVEAIALPAAASPYGQSYNQNEKLQKELAGAATTAVGLLVKPNWCAGPATRKSWWN